MIEKLTDEQVAQQAIYRDKWLKIGLSTEPANRQAAEAGVDKAYAAVGLPAPKKVWADSPLAGAILVGKMMGLSPAEAKKQVGSQISQAIAGCHDAGILSFYDYFANVCGIQAAARLQGHFEISQNAGWWWALDGVAVLTDRPSRLCRDDQPIPRLHSPTGPAIEYRDGFAGYYWHGVSVPKEWIMHPEQIDVQAALNWQNIEQRRAAAEIIGWENIIKKLNAKVIDHDPDPQMGDLLEVDLPNAPGERFLRVQCGTGRTFCLPVPKDCKTAVEANAATFGVDVGDTDWFKNYVVRT